MNKLNADQLKVIATICSKLHIGKEDKAIMVGGFSAGRCSSSKELLYDEAFDMIAHLKKMQGPEVVDPLIKKGIDKMIGKLLYYCHEMGWTATNAAGKKVADFKRLEQWALKFGYLHKKINAYKYDELPKLVSQFEIIYRSHLSSL